jgi:hypothetical protein
MPLPDFFVIGAPKAGTTALHVALARHPRLFMSRVKEPKHFLTDGPPPTGGGPGDAKTFSEYVWRRGDYERLFDAAPAGTLRGESTPFYLHDHAAQQRIVEAVPGARMIALLREPIDRAHSNWTHLWSAGLEPEGDFLRACDLESGRAARGWAQFWRYLELGRYGEQLQRLFEVVPREQVLLLRYRDLREAPVETLDTIFDFLGVETGAVTEIPAENVTTHVTDSTRNRVIGAALRAGSRVGHGRLRPAWTPVGEWLSRHLQREQNLRRPLSPEHRAALLPRVAEDVRLLEQVTGSDFGDWLDAGHAVQRSSLHLAGKIGTGYQSIDDPFGDLAAERPRRRRA